MGERGRQFVRAHHSYAVLAQRFIEAAVVSAEREAAAVAERYARRARPRAATACCAPTSGRRCRSGSARCSACSPQAGLHDLSQLRLLEVGCGAGGNLLELLRLGFAPEHLSGIELLPERLALARAVLPEALALQRRRCAARAGAGAVAGHRVRVHGVLVAARRCLPAAPGRGDVGLAEARRRGAVVRLHGRQPAQPGRARRAAARGCARCFRKGGCGTGA